MTTPSEGLSPGEEYATAVLAVVQRIPRGRAMTYGLIAEIVAESLHRGGPRQVGNVMAGSASKYAHLVDSTNLPADAAYHEAQPGEVVYHWWRVVNAAGRPPARHAIQALAALRADGTPLTADGQRVDLKRAIWFPTDTLSGP